MTEGEARAWLQEQLDVSRETLDRLDRFGAFLRAENERQNLVSRASLDSLWARHIVDSAQLLRHVRSAEGSWLDMGSGAGFPGLVVAALHAGPVTLIEERKLRVEFLERSAELLGVAGRVEIVGSKVERAEARPFDIISARAFAPLDRLFELGTRFSTANTRWILPKGRSAQSELDKARSSWQGDYRLEPSITDPDARIIVAERVRRRAKGKR